MEIKYINKKIEKMGNCDNIKFMKRLFRKWLILRKLKKECSKHTTERSLDCLFSNIKTAIARESFVKQISRRGENYKGKIIINEYNSVLDQAIREELIYVEPHNSLLNLNGSILNPPDKPFFRTTDLGDEFVSMFLWKFFLNNYYARSILTGLAIVLFTLFVNYLFKDVIKSIQSTNPPIVNVYPQILVK